MPDPDMDASAHPDADAKVDAKTDDGSIDRDAMPDGEAGPGPEPDRGCVVSKLLETRYFPVYTTPVIRGSGTLVAAIDDCDGVPFVGLESEDFVIIEDSEIIEPPHTLLPRSGLRVFIQLVVQLGNETVEQQAAIIDAAKEFVARVDAAVDVPVFVAIESFDGAVQHQVIRGWPLPHSSDSTVVNQRIDGLTTQLLSEPTSANLFRALIVGAGDLSTAESTFVTWAGGGSFNTTFLIAVASGADRKGEFTLEATLDELSDGPDRVLAVGLETDQADPVTLRKFARDGFFEVAAYGSQAPLAAAFEDLAVRVIAQIEGTYVLGYCTEKRNGSHTVGVSLTDADQRVTGSLQFTQWGDPPDCSLDRLEDACEDFGCGGIGCGTCGDFATQRCDMDNPIFTAPSPPAIPFAGEGFQCTAGRPASHPVDGEMIEGCSFSCTIPNKCCRSLNSTVWVCQPPNYYCGDFGQERSCDDSGDCTPGTFCCYGGQSSRTDRSCKVACAPDNIACVSQADCPGGFVCGNLNLCEGAGLPDGGTGAAVIAAP